MGSTEQPNQEDPATDRKAGGRARGPKLVLARSWALIWNALGGFGRHHGAQFAASMAYYGLFSIFPAAIVLASAAGFLLDDPSAREDTIEFLFRELPLSETEGRGDIESLVDGVTRNSGTLGIIGAIVLLISASALLSSTRNAVDAIFGGSVTRGLLRGKALDLILVLAIGALFVLSFATSLLAELDPDIGGGFWAVIEDAFTASGYLLPLLLSAVVFSVLYTRLPVEHPPLRDVWPGVIFAAIGYELVKRGFAIYLDNFADYSAIYGSLGAVIAFMVFVFVASIVFLLGAEIAALWPRVRAGAFDPGRDDDDDEPPKSFGKQLLGIGRDLVGRNPSGNDRGRD